MKLHYTCPKCKEIHPTEGEAQLCCNPEQTSEGKWECLCCQSEHEDKFAAFTCCGRERTADLQEVVKVALALLETVKAATDNDYTEKFNGERYFLPRVELFLQELY